MSQMSHAYTGCNAKLQGQQVDFSSKTFIPMPLYSVLNLSKTVNLSFSAFMQKGGIFSSALPQQILVAYMQF